MYCTPSTLWVWRAEGRGGWGGRTAPDDAGQCGAVWFLVPASNQQLLRADINHKMARGKRGAPKATKKVDDSEPPTKIVKEDSGNTKIRRAIKDVKNKEKKTKTYKPDAFLIGTNIKIHEDYSCMLNQTNIGHNNNKFYVIQVAQNGKKFICFTRWGRVGETGMMNTSEFTKVEDAIKAFEKKFKDKTKNNWDKREDFTAHSGKYTYLEMDDEDSDEAEDTTDSGAVLQVGPCFNGKSQLDLRTQLLLNLIFNTQMFTGQMESMKLDVKKMPLGKLSKSQIAKGLNTLLDLEAAIKDNKPHATLSDLSSKFYTIVPHDFGRMVPPVIDDQQVVQTKKEVMMTLSDIELTQSLQKEKANATVHPLDEKYQMLDCSLRLLQKGSEEYKLIQAYATHCSDSRKCKLLDAWTVDRKGEKERASIHDDLDNRKLLWHGTNVAVVAAILKAGLRIMPHSGGRVGKGIYFASEHATSSCYVRCHWGDFEGEKNIGFMFLVEVMLGNVKVIKQDDSTLKKAPAGFHSVLAMGRREPDPKAEKTIYLDEKKVVVPLGKPVNQNEFKDSYFYQSEYLVYKESQARIRYILKFSFN
ncbi:unnamed protein product, partial [Meganyctiphanes norvegica]